jgi:hypothetical protein
MQVMNTESRMLKYVIERVTTAHSADPTALRRIAEGAGVAPRWLRKVVDRDLVDPGVALVERVADYLRSLEPY